MATQKYTHLLIIFEGDFKDLYLLGTVSVVGQLILNPRAPNIMEKNSSVAVRPKSTLDNSLKKMATMICNRDQEGTQQQEQTDKKKGAFWGDVSAPARTPGYIPSVFDAQKMDASPRIIKPPPPPGLWPIYRGDNWKFNCSRSQELQGQAFPVDFPHD